MHTLWVYAAPREGEAVPPRAASGALRRRLLLGVGKTPATFELTRALADGDVDAVIAVGVCGAHRTAGLEIGQLCVVTQDAFADEGVAHPGGFLDLAALGLGEGAPLRADADLCARAMAALPGAVAVGGATVSTCSGTDGLALERAARVPAAIETMEGAAIAWVCAQLGVPWVGLRAVSNFTGDRERAQWDLPGALARLGEACARLHADGW